MWLWNFYFVGCEKEMKFIEKVLFIELVLNFKIGEFVVLFWCSDVFSKVEMEDLELWLLNYEGYDYEEIVWNV